ncbi:MAG: AAC(3) family N-acetyltransferase [Pyrinomonadaceae bacterium]
MGIVDIAKRILPASTVASLARAKKNAARKRVLSLPVLTEADFSRILTDDLGLTSGEVVYVGSSVDQLNLDFPFYEMLHIIRDIIGPAGTVLFPTYPNRSPVSSYEYLQRGNVFDVRRTPSYTGLLSEFARRQRGAVRSLHPTKSVVAIGPDAVELTSTHQNSPYPYDKCSPYYKLVEHDARIIGLGVWTQYLSFVYTIDDAMKASPPVRTYYPEVFAAKCVNYSGNPETVETYAHNMDKVVHDVPAFMRKYIDRDSCIDLEIKGMRFFRADARRLFDSMLELAKHGITPYPRRLYSPEFLGSNSN